MRKIPAAALALLPLALLAPPSEAQSLEVWGSDLWEQLSNQPSLVAFQDVDGGLFHSVGLALDGSIHSWGQMYKPMVSGTPAGNDFVQVDAGEEHSVALRADGSLVSWGEDDYGQVSGTPTGTGFKAVSAGGRHSLALRNDGSIAAWGYDFYGTVSAAPTGTGFVEIACGSYHAVARHANGSLVAWGRNNYLQVTNTPTGNDFVRISAGTTHSLALRSNGRIEAWGQDAYSLVSGAPATGFYQDIAAGGYTDLALDAAGQVAAWGNDSYGTVSGAPSGGGHSLVAMARGVSMAIQTDCNANGVADLADIATGTSTDFDGNSLPDECATPPLYADHLDLSVSAGGIQTFQIDAGPLFKQRVYLLLGTTSGISPGMLFDGQLVPLNLDSYFLQTLMAPNQPPLAGSFGVLTGPTPGPAGQATATLSLPPGLDPALVGVTLHHAFVVIEVASAHVYMVSNPLPTQLLP